MDEAKTLDFDDLMDAGDEFPGFEIAKFTPASESTSNDGVLRTPEHEQEEEEYLRSDSGPNVGNSGSNNTSLDNADSPSNDENTQPTKGLSPDLMNIDGNDQEQKIEDPDDSVPDVEPENVSDKISENDPDEIPEDEPAKISKNEPDKEPDKEPDSVPDKIPENEPENVPEVNGETSDVADDVVDVDKEVKADTADTVEEINDKENEDGEPVKKKKKMYLQAPRPKMQLWGASKPKAETNHSTEVVTLDDDDEDQEGDSVSMEVEEYSDDVVIENGEKDEDCEINDEVNEDKTEEEDPHQQSFLSFLNLKPGSSKPKDNERTEEESNKAAFYSRKRLRTRKKVTYFEDVGPDSDDDYKVEDDDDEELDDHMMDDQRNIKPRSRTNSKSPAKVFGATPYAAALQNLLPGVDLSCLKKPAPSPTPPRPVTTLPRIGPKSFMNSLANSSIINTPANLKGLFECGLCGTFFNTASQFITHQETKHAGEKKPGRSAMETFRCEVCGFVLTNRFAYQEHKRMKHNNKGGGPLIFNCNKCKVGKFTNLGALQKHQMSCGSPFCSTCGSVFSTWVEVAEHRRKVHTDPGQGQTRQWLNCVNKTCTFKCVTQHEMRLHVQQRHSLNELFTCNAPKCSRVFSSRDELTEHKKEAHASEFIVQYQCMECKNCFSSKTLLAEHQYLHTLEKLRKCDLCSRHFSSIIELRKHKDVHAVKGSVRCQSCLRWCADKLELVNHVCAQKRRTSGIRLYFCDVCHKDFRSDQKMFQHRKEHKNFFQCASCLWNCTSETEYFKHREEHGRYTCGECCEELEEKNVETHQKAHRYYIKMEEMDTDGKNEKVMFLYPNLVNVMKA